MICEKPYCKAPTDVDFDQIVKSKKFRDMAGMYPCGKCLPCLNQRAMVWSNRIELESMLYETSTVITLTYNDEHLPKDGHLQKRDIDLFLKKVRNTIKKVRYFITAEYGPKTHRPHYHGVLFGINPYSYQKELFNCWQKSNPERMTLDTTHRKSINYVTTYLTDPDKHFEVEGKPKPFTMMSKKPGLGHDQVLKIANQLKKFPYHVEMYAHNFIQLGKRKVLLGRYLTKVYLDALGVPENVQELASAMATLKKYDPYMDQRNHYHKALKENKQKRENIKDKIRRKKNGPKT